tara:strand:- start:46 stop:726 length:681 start_codon:yes stop_codon:yes gene_type:complete
MGAGQRYRGFGGGAVQQQVAGQAAQVGQMGALAASDLDAQELQDIDLQQKQLRQIGQEQAYILEQQRKAAKKAGRSGFLRGLSSLAGSVVGGVGGFVASGFNPLGALAGVSAGSQIGGTAYDTFSDEDMKMAAGIPDKDIEEFLKKSATPGKFKYKPGVTGPDASPARVGTTTARMKQSELGKQMVREQGGVETLPGNNPTPQDMSTIIASLGYLYRQMEEGKKNG